MTQLLASSPRLWNFSNFNRGARGGKFPDQIHAISKFVVATGRSQANIGEVMQTRLQQSRTRRSHMPGGDCRVVLFSVCEARRALTYVSGIARDAAEAFGIVQSIRIKLHQAGEQTEQESLSAIRDAALRRLNIAIDDCNAVGADLVDIALGEVQFWTEVDGRRASLKWRVGESIADAWREVARV
jgi:hypothetical protein